MLLNGKGNMELPGPAGMLQRWMAPQCQDAYPCQSTPHDSEMSWGVAQRGAWGPRDVKRVCVREDQHRRGRGSSTDQFGHHVYISHEYKFVWVRVLKSASTQIWSLLNQHFGRALDCAGSRVLPHSALSQACWADLPNLQIKKSGRDNLLNLSSAPSGHQCLSRRILNDYFFFAFIRDPVLRFPSSMAQTEKHRQAKARAEGQGTELVNVTAVLESMLASADMFDHHLETQALALASRVVLSDPPTFSALPLDFLGRVEAFEEDFRELWLKLEQHSGRLLPPLDSAALVKKLNVRWLEKNVMAGYDEHTIDAMVRKVYWQDLKCFA